MKRKGIVIFGAVIVILLSGGLLMWSLRNVKCQETFTVCTPDGETAQVTFDVEQGFSLLRPDAMRGTITIGEITYTSVWDIYGDEWEGESLWFHQYTGGYALDNLKHTVLLTLDWHFREERY